MLDTRRRMKFYVARGLLAGLFSLLLSATSLFSVQPGQVRWTYSSGLTNHTDLALGPDGTIYLGWGTHITETIPFPSGGTTTTNYYTNHLFAIQTDGVEKWQFPGTGQSLALRSDGKILAGAGITVMVTTTFPLASGGLITSENPVDNGMLSGVNPDGSSWFAAIKASRVAIAADDNVSALNVEVPEGSPHTNGVARLDLQTTGTGWTNLSLAFPYTTSSTSPVITPDGMTCYVTLSSLNPRQAILLPSNQYLYGPNPNFPSLLHGILPDGTLKYQLFETNVNYSAPAVGQDGTLYLASGKRFQNGQEFTVDWQFRAIKLPRSFLWSISNTNPFGPAAIDSTNNVYVGSGTRFYALSANGEERWTYEGDSTMDLCPALSADGTVYAVTRGGKLLALSSATGCLLWSYDCARPIHFPPTIAPDGTVYLLVDSSDLLAIQGTAGPANAPWPQDRHDAQRTSRATQASTGGVSRNGEGKFSVNLNLEPGRVYKVEASEDLLTWMEIGSFTSSSAAQTFLDESSTGKSQRFYRLVVP